MSVNFYILRTIRVATIEQTREKESEGRRERQSEALDASSIFQIIFNYNFEKKDTRTGRLLLIQLQIEWKWDINGFFSRSWNAFNKVLNVCKYRT